MQVTAKQLCGHRGVAAEAPENTLASIHKVLFYGMEWVEIDVQLSADGIPVIFHDAVLERCTNGTGYLAHTKLPDLMQLDAGSHFSADFAGERIPTLQQVMQFTSTTSLHLNIEIKVYPSTDIIALCEAIFRAIRQDNIPMEQLLFSSFSHTALQYCAEHFPLVRRSLLWESIPNDWLAYRHLASYGIHCDYRYLTAEKAQQVKAAGLALQCYTPNHPSVVTQHWDWGVDIIITDAPNAYLVGVGESVIPNLQSSRSYR